MYIKKISLFCPLFLWIPFLMAQQPMVKLSSSDYITMRKGFPGISRLLTSGQKVTVAFLGGSITYNEGWRNKTCDYLRQRFPGTDFHFIAAGIPSLGSLPHAFRLQRDVLDSGRIDLLFIEAAVNDRGNGADSVTQINALEGIVRHAKRSNPAMDIVLMSFVDPLKMADYDNRVVPVEVINHERIAAHYGLPSINLAKEVYDRIKAREFDWEHDFKDLHPSPFGQEVYFHSIQEMLKQYFDGAAAVPSNSKYRLPDPLASAPFENGKYVSLTHAVIDKNWKLSKDWSPSDTLPTREGFTHVPVLEADAPGAALNLSFKGNAVGLAVISGADAGKIRYSIDNGEMIEKDLYTPWSSFLHLPWYVLLASNLKPGKHILRIAVSSSHNPLSKGYACRVAHFLVNLPVN